jgi:putative component of toxin-antitoxin plasmid stabilization module
MPLWKIGYYPEQDDKKSPYTRIQSLTDVNEAVFINRKLELLADLNRMAWSNFVELKPIEKDIFQITAGNHRIYLSLDQRQKTIVVFHVCRKVGQRARKVDIQTAIKNKRNYFGE